MANRIVAAAPNMGGRHREEGTILGGIQDLLEGENR
jgi:hypothetical protein